ncbi:MAG: NAD-dependent protein deacylase [Armatimonadetes bacterium]|nr:NAD-dependent protein deacylase [Armatimonadota bacterium]
MEISPETHEQLINTLAKARRVFVFTGAGASKESGLPTFRDIDGEWSKHDPMTFATFEGFLANPVKVWNLYRLRQRQIAEAKPNSGHITIARMESFYPEFLLCTQNVDDLHERAGSRKMVKLHGDAWQMRCLETGDVFDTRELDLPEEFTEETLPRCPECGSLCRPNIVWFGEYVPREAMMASIASSSSCDLMLVVGTSGEVSGGYGFAEYALANRATIVEVNPSQGALTRYATFWIPEPAGTALPRIWELVTARSQN